MTKISQDSFIIDTADWDNHSDAEIAHDIMAKWLAELTQDELEELYNVMAADRESGEFEQRTNPTNPMMIKCLATEELAFTCATATYSELGMRYLTGHNCTIELA